jgi:hypothetical protein
VSHIHLRSTPPVPDVSAIDGGSPTILTMTVPHGGATTSTLQETVGCCSRAAEQPGSRPCASADSVFDQLLCLVPQHIITTLATRLATIVMT